MKKLMEKVREMFPTATSVAGSEDLPGEHAFDSILQEAKELREQAEIQEANLKKQYQDLEDSEKAFPNEKATFKIPSDVHGVSRTYVEQHLREMLHKENQALLSARIYRDKCTELQRRCGQLEYEKEGVRFFWRNSGRLFKRWNDTEACPLQ